MSFSLPDEPIIARLREHYPLGHLVTLRRRASKIAETHSFEWDGDPFDVLLGLSWGLQAVVFAPFTVSAGLPPEDHPEVAAALAAFKTECELDHCAVLVQVARLPGENPPCRWITAWFGGIQEVHADLSSCLQDVAYKARNSVISVISKP